MIIDKIEFEERGKYDDPFIVVIITFRDEHDHYRKKKIETIGIFAEDFRDQLAELIKKHEKHFYKHKEMDFKEAK